MSVRPPAPAPCGSCPYRRDVPSGVWAREEYEKLPRYDGPTWAQDPGVFMCHRQDGRLCAGWVACHDRGELLAIRLGAASGSIRPEDVEEILGYETSVPVFASGAEAAEHGLRDLLDPGDEARRLVRKLTQ